MGCGSTHSLDVFDSMFVKSFEQYNMFYYFRTNVKHVILLPFKLRKCYIIAVRMGNMSDQTG